MQVPPRSSLAAPLLLALAVAAAPCWATGTHAEHGKKAPASKSAASKKAAPKKPHGPLADLKNVPAGKDVVKLANWVSYTYDSQRRPFVIVDKKDARMYVFDGWGRLWSTSPVLVGATTNWV